MFRRYSYNAMRCGGALRLTSPLYFPWGKHNWWRTDNHRLPRKRPWWSGVAVLSAAFIFVNATSAGLYFGNRWYQSWRASGDTISVSLKVDEKVFVRPDLAVVAVRVLLHHVLSDCSTPFGCPMVAPTTYREEVEQLCDFVWQLHQEHPAYSIPDLWSLLTARALSRLSGPHVEVLRGRRDVSAHGLTRETMVQFTPNLIPETERNILQLKRTLAHQHLSLGDMVAVIGCYRALGFHNTANFHTNREVNVANWMRYSKLANNELHDIFEIPDDIHKCTPDPYIFSNHYFNLLLDYNWKQPGWWWKSNDYRCSEHDRRREVRLIDPIAAKKNELKEQWARRKEAKQIKKQKPFFERLINAVTPDDVKRQRAKGTDSDAADEVHRSGEAQSIPGIEELIEQEEKRYQRAVELSLLSKPSVPKQGNEKINTEISEKQQKNDKLIKWRKMEETSIINENASTIAALQNDNNKHSTEENTSTEVSVECRNENANHTTSVRKRFTKWFVAYVKPTKTVDVEESNNEFESNTATNNNNNNNNNNNSNKSNKLYDPCLHVSMQAIDISLLDDALTYGWVYHYGNNEPDFYAAVSDLVLSIQAQGHDRNNLYYEF